MSYNLEDIVKAIDLSSLPIGKKLARSIFDWKGRLLLPRGIELKASHLLHLINLECEQIYIEEDELLDSDETRKTPGDNPLELRLQRVFIQVVENIKNLMAKIVAGHIVKRGEVEEAIDLLYEEVTNTNNVLHCLWDLRHRDEYTFQHSVAVSVLSVKIGQILDLPENKIRSLGLAGLLHDMGKCRISVDILNKAGSLSYDELQEIYRHPRYGYDIVKQIDFKDPAILAAVLQHHEHLDGRGYPRQIRSDDINLFSRVVAVADVFDALTSERFYRPRFPLLQALDELQRETSGHLDPLIAKRVVQYVMNMSTGETVMLSTGEKATIILPNEIEPLRPLVKTDKTFIDLRQNRKISIENRF